MILMLVSTVYLGDEVMNGKQTQYANHGHPRQFAVSVEDWQLLCLEQLFSNFYLVGTLKIIFKSQGTPE
jgi:hypothetical protein